ncbi:hypothetical protein [Geoalkalibacter halelectricus]|uniref:hypothetical protein n=1 Tax=Geoalkalibacter halelectricus TaxID=2847045 RepID=UPI003D1D1154
MILAAQIVFLTPDCLIAHIPGERAAVYDILHHNDGYQLTGGLAGETVVLDLTSPIGSLRVPLPPDKLNEVAQTGLFAFYASDPQEIFPDLIGLAEVPSSLIYEIKGSVALLASQRQPAVLPLA